MSIFSNGPCAMLSLLKLKLFIEANIHTKIQITNLLSSYIYVNVLSSIRRRNRTIPTPQKQPIYLRIKVSSQQS